MFLVQPSATVLDSNIPYEYLLKNISGAVSACYMMPPPDCIKDMEKYVAKRLNEGHDSVIEHSAITVELVTNRGVTHELVRHRLCAYTQESTRYCNYSKGRFGNSLTMCLPSWWDTPIDTNKNWSETEIDKITDLPPKAKFWWRHMFIEEKDYMDFLAMGATPQEARGLLPNDLKARIYITANIREWRHILRLRFLGTTGSPHPDMKQVMRIALEQLACKYPLFFLDIQEQGEK